MTSERSIVHVPRNSLDASLFNHLTLNSVPSPRTRWGTLGAACRRSSRDQAPQIGGQHDAATAEAAPSPSSIRFVLFFAAMNVHFLRPRNFSSEASDTIFPVVADSQASPSGTFASEVTCPQVTTHGGRAPDVNHFLPSHSAVTWVSVARKFVLGAGSKRHIVTGTRPLLSSTNVQRPNKALKMKTASGRNNRIIESGK